MKETEKKRNSFGRRAWEAALNALYPPRCPLCDELLKKEERLCCAACEKKLPLVRQPACMKCGKPLERGELEECPDCQRVRHAFDRGAAAFTYTGQLRRSVYRMKFENRRDYLDFYGEYMARALAPYRRLWRPDFLLPVPMHWRKERARGYNQSALLAEKVSVRTGIPVERGLLQCGRFTASQKTLNRQERLLNLRGSFSLREGYVEDAFPGGLGGLRVLVIDDVYTTGSTMDEVSRILKEAGAGQVYFLVLCIGKGKKAVFID